MSTTHGDIKEITFNHLTLGSGRFRAKSGEGNTYKLGGFENNDDNNSIDSAGELIMIKNRVRGILECMVVNATAEGAESDADIARQLNESAVAADWTFTTQADAVFAGNGFIVGEIAPDLNAGTFTLKLAVGKWNKIA